jgi:hypothetical protein
MNFLLSLFKANSQTLESEASLHVSRAEILEAWGNHKDAAQHWLLAGSRLDDAKKVAPRKDLSNLQIWSRDCWLSVARCSRKAAGT